MITSLQNPLVRRIRALRNKTDRNRHGVFLIEGEKEIRLAAAGGVELEILAYCPDLLPDNEIITSEERLETFVKGFSNNPPEPVVVAKHVYEKLAYRESTGGLIAIAKIPDRNLADIKIPDSALILVVHGLEKPGNLGAILRTADGAGVSVVCACDCVVDLYNPNVVRASLGALFTVPTVKTETETLFAWLKNNHFNIFSASPDAKTSYLTADYTGKTALVVGSEHQGLPDTWLQPPVQPIHIPMQGRMDSLNVSCSAAILLYEAVRQRC